MYSDDVFWKINIIVFYEFYFYSKNIYKSFDFFLEEIYGL